MASAIRLAVSQLPELTRRLERFFPLSLKAYYLAQSVHGGQWSGVEFVVDDWPDFGALVYRPAKGSDGKHFSKFTAKNYGLYGESRERLTRLLSIPGIVNWEKDAIFSAVRVETELDALRDATGERGKLVDGEPARMYYREIDEQLPDCSLPDGWTATKIPQDAVGKLMQNWAFGTTEGAEEYIKQCLQFPSCALWDAKGEMMGCLMSHEYGSNGLLFVDKSVRRQGVALELAHRLQKAMLEAGRKNTFVYAAYSNEAAHQFAHATGFSVVPKGDSLRCYYTPASAKL
ncbi:PREDICTED: glycine N-acyltransferase-like protein 2 [Priapulus caudatus]|uniref:Glycine N-acyltransferase-like protein n=1 Tax=Priapulus caudatus TaxID=37621 RepID=A0ABM1DWX6_PRICU|nr:PREDICTED: glycine N-acyltransferase-like protein 2 [Priapulus caudatus]XP_014664448.1 PREDICTED: glycine N-acyltransferase-like protein 2 [Priapulus caudatus]XP_014664449.1 PREDICTED: glycine N-acyltransferase-like protein 2 [Priapulus caudatus]